MPYEYRGPHPGITEPQVKLADGRMVSSWSNEWWVECYDREWQRIKDGRPRRSPKEIQMRREAIEIGRLRRSNHAATHKDNARFYDDQNTEDVMGAYGEIRFADRYGLSVDRSVKKGGDGGIDFTVDIEGDKSPLTIDVKTFKPPAIHMLVKAEHMKAGKVARIFVLAVDDGERLEFLGWSSKKEMQTMPIKPFVVGGPDNHYLHQSKLQPMEKLDAIMARRINLDATNSRNAPSSGAT